MSDKLILTVTASFTGAVGYGYVYKCHIVKKNAGALDEDSIVMTILAGDKENLAFVSSHLDPVEFEVGFKKKSDNEPYRLAPISGFVDQNNVSWEIDYLKSA